MNRQQRRELERYQKQAKIIGEPDPKRIMVAFAHPGMVHTAFMLSVLQLIYSGKYDLQIVEAYSGPVISMARNTIAEHFLALPQRPDYLLTVDTDMVFDADTIDLLVEAKKPIVSALYYALYPTPGDHNPVILNGPSEDDGLYYPVTDIDESIRTPIEVGGVGMGCCLIEAEVIETLGADRLAGVPFKESVINGVSYGEDLTFCISAREAGFPSYYVPAARAGHRKTVTL